MVLDSEIGFSARKHGFRSLWLNFEMTLIIYSCTEAQELEAMIARYQAETELLDSEKWQQRGPGIALKT